MSFPSTKIGSGQVGVLLQNKSAAKVLKGTIVEASTKDSAFTSTDTTDFMPIGVAAEDIEKDAFGFVAVTGVVEVLLEDGTAGTASYWVKTSDSQGGRADATNASPPGGGVIELTEHARELGHCIQSVPSGTDVLCRIILHFN